MRKYIAANWHRLLPFVTFLIFLRLMRGEIRLWVFYVTAAICLAVYFRFKPRVSFRMITVLAATLLFAIGFLSKSRDLEVVLPVLGMYVLGLAGLWVWIGTSPRSGFRIGVPAVLIALAAADLLHGHRALKVLWDFHPPAWMRGMEAVVSVFPYGTYLAEDLRQAYRYPELVSRDFNLLGNRWRKCRNGGLDCREDIEAFPYSIWTTFLFTKEFSRLFVTEGAMSTVREKLRNSYPQGVIDQRAGAFTIRPLCSFDGYLDLKVTGDRMLAVIAVREARTVELPVVRARNLKISFTGNAAMASRESPLFPVDVKPGFSEVQIAVGPPWKIAVMLFWLGPLLWLLAFAASGLRGLALRKK